MKQLLMYRKPLPAKPLAKQAKLLVMLTTAVMSPLAWGQNSSAVGISALTGEPMSAQEQLDNPATAFLLPPNNTTRANSSLALGSTEMPRSLSVVPRGNPQKQLALAAGAAVKISVRKSGWYRVTQPQLIAAGLNPAALPRSLQLFVEGVEVPIQVSGQNKPRLESSDYIEFYGVALDTTLTDTRVYWLSAGTGTGLRIRVGVTSAPAVSAPGFFTAVVEAKSRMNYFVGLRNGDQENFLGPVIFNTVLNQTLIATDPALDASVPNAAAATITLELAIHGVSSVAHVVDVKFNGVALGTMSFTGQTRQVARFPVPKTALRAGANVISFTATGGRSDASMLDYARLHYPRQYRAANNSLTLTAAGGQTIKLSGFTNAATRVLDITNPAIVAEVTPQVQETGSSQLVAFKAPGSGTRTLLAFATGQFLSPAAVVRNNPSTWNTLSHGADFVMISHTAFMSSLTPLVNHRQQQGLRVQVIDVEDLFDEFSFSIRDPLAIKKFLTRSKSWSRAPRFVLLVGDSSLDPRNYQGKGNFDFVPTKLLDTTTMETASDDWLADFNNDGLPEMAVGRFPVRTVAQANVIVSKVIGYTGVPLPDQAALLVADEPRGYHFEGANDVVAIHIGDRLPIQRINRDEATDSVIHSRVLEALNQGPFVVNYMGHGSISIWTNGSMLRAPEVLTLRNGRRLSLFVINNCLNGYFQDPVEQSMAESLLLAPSGGAIAVWASAALTAPQEQQKVNSEFYHLMFEVQGAQRPRTLGEAVAKAKAASPDINLRRTWILIGDPTTPFGPGPATPPATTTDTQNNAADSTQDSTNTAATKAMSERLSGFSLSPLLRLFPTLPSGDS